MRRTHLISGIESCLLAALIVCAPLAIAADGDAASEGGKLENEVKQLLAESDKLLMTEKGFSRDKNAVAEGLKKLERAEELAAKASELNPDKYDKLAQVVAMKLYGARKNTTLNLETPRRAVASAPAANPPPRPVAPPPAPPVVAAVKEIADASKPAPPPVTTPPEPPAPAAPPAVVADVSTPKPPPTPPPEPETASRRRAATASAEPETSSRRRTEATAPDAPAAPATALPVAPPIIRKEKVFVLKDGKRIVALRVFDTETEHVIKDIAGKTHAVSREDVAQIVEQETVIGGVPGQAAAPKKNVTVYVLKDGRTINAVKVLDAGEQLSIKDDRNRFIVIEKTDVVEPKL